MGREDDLERDNQKEKRYGRWQVLDAPVMITARGDRKVLCRCDCGTERYVLERSLKYGSSKSCGCLTVENVKKAKSQDLTGMQFGSLTVLRRVEGKSTTKGVIWRCICSCGNTYDVAATLLLKKRRTHCNNRSAHGGEHNYSYVDIAGKRFGRLTAVAPTKKRDGKGSVVWVCRCDCGNEIELSYNQLAWSGRVSCGCKKQENNQKLKDFQAHADGTSIDVIKSKRLPRNNTSGYKGVGFTRGRWYAKIVFQQKQYCLGTFDKIEEAVEARRAAETLLFDETAAYYARWKAKAKSDPVWAEENPIRIRVIKDSAYGLTVSYSPKL